MERYYKRKCPSPENSVATQESPCGNFDAIMNLLLPSNMQPEPPKLDYQTRLRQFVLVIKLILRQGLTFSVPHWDTLRREKLFVELVELYDKQRNPNGVIPKNAGESLPEANAMTQEGLIRAATKQTTSAIVKDMGGDFFAVHIAGFYNAAPGLSIAVVVRYVNKEGIVKERLIGFLKATIFSGSLYKEDLDSLLSEHGLSSSKIRGQSYDGDCSFRREFNELRDLIIKENSSAYHTHCSTKQLHSTLIDEGSFTITFGTTILDILNAVFSRCKSNDESEKKEKETAQIMLAFTNTEQTPEEMVDALTNTRWKFNYKWVPKVIDLFLSVTDALYIVSEEGIHTEERHKARWILEKMESFLFVYGLHFAVNVLEVTNELSLALEKKDRDVASIVTLVAKCKEQLQGMRAEGWECFFAQVSSFCQKYAIPIPNKDEKRFHKDPQTKLEWYRDNLFYFGLDSQLEVLNDIFGDTSIELLVCSSCLNPSNSFQAFDKPKLLKLAQFYPNEFSANDLITLEHELDKYILTVRSDKRLSNLNSLGELSRVLVNTKYHDNFPLVYLLLKLALLLPITALIDPVEERSASAMKRIETELKEQINDQLMKDSLVTYVEKHILDHVPNDAIVDCFLS